MIHNWRLSLVFLFAAMISVCALALPGVRISIGILAGFALLRLARLVARAEKSRRSRAAAIQEEFDTSVFQLPWSRLPVERPSVAVIAKAAARYDGGRVSNWYPDTLDVQRPL